jgi:hypothetical protein
MFEMMKATATKSIELFETLAVRHIHYRTEEPDLSAS